MKRFALTFMVMGISCSISQVLLAREFMTVLGGNELILRVLFVNWFHFLDSHYTIRRVPHFHI